MAEQRQPAAPPQPKAPEEPLSGPLFTSAKVDEIKQHIEAIHQAARDLPSSDELAAFLFTQTQATIALMTLQAAEVERAALKVEE